MKNKCKHNVFDLVIYTQNGSINQISILKKNVKMLCLDIKSISLHIKSTKCEKA